MIARLTTLATLLLFALSCIPPEETVYEGVVIDLSDAGSQRIYDHQNTRSADSLLVYLSHPNPSYRYLAARAFGSFPTIEAPVLDSLGSLLGDPESLVRSAAAYAIGQSGREAAGELLSGAFDGSGADAAFNAAVLAAIGKVGGERQLEQLSSIETYLPTDTLLNGGRAWGLYYLARRGLVSDPGSRVLAQILLDPASPPDVALPAAYFYQRFATPDTARTEAFDELLRNSPETIRRLAAARHAGRLALLRALENEPDWRVRTEIVRALGDQDYSAVRDPMVEALRDDHPLVAVAAATHFIKHGVPFDATFYRQLARDSLPNTVRFLLYQAANKHLPRSLEDYRGRIAFDLQRAYTNPAATSVERAAALRAFGAYPWYYRLIQDYYPQTDDNLVRTTIAEVLSTISRREDFDVFFRRSSTRVRSDLAGYFQQMITDGEVGPAYHAGEALAAGAGDYRRFFPEVSWLDQALKRFELPREIETYRAVQSARDALADREHLPRAMTAAARPIDWSRIGTAGQEEIEIRTPAGPIRLQLYPEAAPATVSAFLSLVDEAYYDGRVFHRVVPNFVAQGGGPLGTGFGSEDFVIRTETPGLHWDRAGLIGMASAGKDTEGVQFFLTHQPTPHLDGNYTIFGAVTEGQEVVDRLLPGTPIESISVQ